MIQSILAGFISFSLGAIIAGWYGFDYGTAKQKAIDDEALQTFIKKSVTQADKTEAKEKQIKVVYRDIIKTIETATDETKCLDVNPPVDIVDGVRNAQSFDD